MKKSRSKNCYIKLVEEKNSMKVYENKTKNKIQIMKLGREREHSPMVTTGGLNSGFQQLF